MVALSPRFRGDERKIGQESCAVLQRAPHHGSNKVAPVFARGLMILQWIDGYGCGFSRGAKRRVARRLAVECGFGLRNAARGGLGAADADMRVRDLAFVEAI